MCIGDTDEDYIDQDAKICTVTDEMALPPKLRRDPTTFILEIVDRYHRDLNILCIGPLVPLAESVEQIQKGFEGCVLHWCAR